MNSGSKYLKTAKNNFTELMWFSMVPSKFQKIHLIGVSGHCKRYIFKIYQTVVNISMIVSISQFFRILLFDGFFVVWPNCALEVPLLIFPAFVSNLRRPRPSFFFCFSQSLWQRPLLGYGRFWHYQIWN